MRSKLQMARGVDRLKLSRDSSLGPKGHTTMSSNNKRPFKRRRSTLKRCKSTCARLKISLSKDRIKQLSSKPSKRPSKRPSKDKKSKHERLPRKLQPSKREMLKSSRTSFIVTFKAISDIILSENIIVSEKGDESRWCIFQFKCTEAPIGESEIFRPEV